MKIFDNMQFSFMAGKSTTDAIFIVRQLQEKYLARNKELWMAFVDLEKAFDRVPREVVWWALRWKKGMELKGLRVNIGKTKVMRCQVRIGQAEDSGKYPCGMCREGVGDNSINCVACHRCLDGDSAQVVLLSEVELEPGVKVECVPKYCYLGDTLGSGEQWCRHGGMGGPDPPLLFRPLLRLAQIR